MEFWRNVWRNGLVPQLSLAGLDALRLALVRNDDRLLQGATTSPPAMQAVAQQKVVAACAVGFCGWQGDGLTTVAQVNGFFARTCMDADAALGEPAAGRRFLDWFDHTPRDRMREQLLEEVNRALAQRSLAAA